MIEFALDTEHPVIVPCERVNLEGVLHIPPAVKGIIIFAHGSGSSRLSPRNQHIARELQQTGFATLLFDLLTAEEDEIDTNTAQFRFDIDFLANRLGAATQWVQKNPVLRKLPVGYFGASTGGGAALVSAARLANVVRAVVSRGGRPDLAGESLRYVRAPTLLIVGALDEAVIELNKQAMQEINCETQLEIVPGATHLFEEPGKLDEVSKLAKQWFKKYLITYAGGQGV